MGSHGKGLKFARQNYRMRMLGFVLAMLPVAVALYRLPTPPWQWWLFAACALLWPQLAWWHAARAADPTRSERLNLVLDVALLGAWVALMRFNLLPSALLAAVMAMDRISAGGWRLLTRAMLAGVFSCVLVAWANGFAWQPASDMRDVLACLPLLAVYPLWLSTVNFRQARRIHEQNLLLARLNRTDTLTGLANRSWLLECADKELQRFRRSAHPACLIMLDADGFKQLNDRHGHAAGDAFLRAMAVLLKQNLRNVDTPGRLGGDEFAIILPETDLTGAGIVAERIRQSVASVGRGDAGLPPCTLSLGVAAADAQLAKVEDWFKHADAALYRAKALGRNRVCLAEPTPAPAPASVPAR